MRFCLTLPRRARSLAVLTAVTAGLVHASALSAQSAQLSPADSIRLSTSIRTLVYERGLDAGRAARAGDALREAAGEAEIRDALLFVYAADAALSWESEVRSDTIMGYDRHFLVRLGEAGLVGEPSSGYVRRANPNGFDPLATMASRWIPSLGEPKVRYAEFDDVDEDVVREAGDVAYADTASLGMISTYLNLRDRGVPSDQAYDSVTVGHALGRSFLMNRLFYPWGHRLLRDYDMFNAGADAREFLEAHHVFWYKQYHRDARPVQAFSAPDPMAMLSRRIMDAVRSDRATIRRLLDAVIDSVLAEPTVVVQPPPDTPSDTPSFVGLENANPSEMRGLTFTVKTAPTTASTYRHRLSVLHAYVATLDPGTREMLFGRRREHEPLSVYDSDGVVALVEETRRTQGEAAAYQTLDRMIVRTQINMR